jgi:hypothetical protein
MIRVEFLVASDTLPDFIEGIWKQMYFNSMPFLRQKFTSS